MCKQQYKSLGNGKMIPVKSIRNGFTPKYFPRSLTHFHSIERLAKTKQEICVVKFLLGSSLSAIHSPNGCIDTTTSRWIELTSHSEYSIDSNGSVGDSQQGPDLRHDQLKTELVSIRENNAMCAEQVATFQTQMKHVLNHIHLHSFTPGELEETGTRRNIWFLLLDELKKAIYPQHHGNVEICLFINFCWTCTPFLLVRFHTLLG